MSNADGRSEVEIRADLSKLNADLADMQRRILAAAQAVENRGKVTLKADTTQVRAAAAQVQQLDSAIQKASGRTITTETGPGRRAVQELIGEINKTISAAQKLDSQSIDPEVGPGRLAVQQLSAEMDAAIVRAKALDETDISPKVDLDTRDVETKANESGTRAGAAFSKRMAENSTGWKKSIDAAFQGVILSATVAGGAAAAAFAAGGAAGGFAVKSIAQIEQVQIAFEGLFKSEAIAGDFLDQLQEFAARTPFEFQQLTGSAQRFLGAFGAGFRDELIPTLQTIGDVAGALGAPAASIDRVTTALLQIKGRGRVAAEELMQIREALPGFDPLPAIARQLGVSVPEAMKQLEKGAVSANDGIEAILAGMRAFPGAAGAMDRQSLTLNGRISTLKDTLQIASRQGFAALALSVGDAVDVFAGELQPGGRLDSVITNIGASVNTAFQAIAPELLGFAETLGQGIGDILAAVGPALAEVLPAVQRVIPPVVEALSALITAFAGAATNILPAIETLAGLISGLDPTALQVIVEAIIALKIGATVAAGVQALAKAFGATGLAASTALGPITLVAAAIAALFFLNTTPPSGFKILQDDIADAIPTLTASTTAFIENKEALAGLTTEAQATAKAYELLGSALSGIKIPEIERPDGIRGLLQGTIFTPSTTTDFLSSGLLSVEQALGSLNLTAKDTFPVLEAIRSGNYLNLSKSAFESIKPIRDLLRSGVDEGTLTVEMQNRLDAFKTLLDVANGADLDGFIRESLTASAANDTMARTALNAAENLTGIDRNGKDLVPLYIEFTNQVRLLNTELDTTGKVVPNYAAFAEGIALLLDPADRAEAALEGFRSALDELQNQKLDFTQQQIALQEFFDSVQFGGGGTLNIDTAEGRANTQSVLEGVQIANDLAQQVTARSGSEFGLQFLIDQLDVIKQQFIDAGGNADEFDALLRENALDPITFQVQLDTSTQATLQAEIDKISKEFPEIDAVLKPVLEAKDYALVEASLNKLAELDEAEQKVFLDDVSRTSTEEALNALASEEYIATIEGRADPSMPQNIRDALSRNAFEILINGDPDEAQIQRALASKRYYVKLAANDARFDNLNYAGGYYQSFHAGGWPMGSNIANTPSQYAPGDTPRYMWGEPSTHGEYFLSMHPAYKDRNVALWESAGRRLGVLGNRLAGTGEVSTAAQLGKVVRQLRRLESAFREMPPITVNAATGEEAGAKVYYAHRKRVALFG